MNTASKYRKIKVYCNVCLDYDKFGGWIFEVFMLFLVEKCKQTFFEFLVKVVDLFLGGVWDFLDFNRFANCN